MKRILSLCVIATISTAALADQCPNPGFTCNNSSCKLPSGWELASPEYVGTATTFQKAQISGMLPSVLSLDYCEYSMKTSTDGNVTVDINYSDPAKIINAPSGGNWQESNLVYTCQASDPSACQYTIKGG